MPRTSGEEKASVMNDKAQRALPCRRREILEVEGLPEGLKNSLRRPAASLLRLATLSDFRPSDERQTVHYTLTF